MKKFLRFSLVVLGVATGATYGSSGTEWVAQPWRSIDAQWEVPQFAGRDLWMMFKSELQTYPGVSQEELIQNAGLANIRLETFGALVQKNLLHRQIAMQGLQLLTASGNNVAANVKVKVDAGGDLEAFHAEALTDGVASTWFVARGDQFNDDLRNEVMRVSLNLPLATAQEVVKITCRSGIRGEAEVGTMEVQVRRGDQWVAVPGKGAQTLDRFDFILDRPVTATEWRIVCTSKLRQLVMHPEKLPYQEILKTRPFFFDSRTWRAGNGNLLGLRAEQFDQDSFRSFLTAYQNTFVGFLLPEWDSNLRGMRGRGQLDDYLPKYDNRDDAYEKVKNYFTYQKTLFNDNVHAMSGNITWPQYAAEWGAKTLSMSVSGSHPNLPTRSCIMFARSAGRQYGLPWTLYVTAFAPGMAHPTPNRPDIGKPASLVRREFFAGYYQGATFLELEGSENSLVAKDENQENYRLNQNGETLKHLYEWSQKKEGDRGTSFAPILGLVDLKHGRGGRRGWGGDLDWKIWDYLEMGDGDYMIEHVVRTVDRYIDSAGTSGGLAHYEPFSWNMRNSRIGDIVDLFIANPPSQGGVVKKEHLEKYPVVMLLGEMRWDRELEARLKEYVKSGGTLLINSAQCEGVMAEPAFLGVKLGQESVLDGDLEVRALEPLGATILMKSKSGKPLVTRHQFGAGNVIVTTPRYLLSKDKKKPAPLVEEILLKLQDEVLPIKVAGNVEFMLNRTKDGRWIAVLINNEGIIKHPTDPGEMLLASYASPVNLLAPVGTTVREVLGQEDVQTTTTDGGQIQVNISVPAGGIRILEFTGIKLSPAKK